MTLNDAAVEAYRRAERALKGASPLMPSASLKRLQKDNHAHDGPDSTEFQVRGHLPTV